MDVAAALGYADTDQAVRAHCKSFKLFKRGELALLGVADAPSRGLILIPEWDVYRLIMRSKLPSAQRFEVWVVEDVLPSIRKTGSYRATRAQAGRRPGLGAPAGWVVRPSVPGKGSSPNNE